MSEAPDKVLAAVLELPREARIRAVERLLGSLDDEEADGLDDADRARLHAAIRLSESQFARGEEIPAEAVLRRLSGR